MVIDKTAARLPAGHLSLEHIIAAGCKSFMTQADFAGADNHLTGLPRYRPRNRWRTQRSSVELGDRHQATSSLDLDDFTFNQSRVADEGGDKRMSRTVIDFIGRSILKDLPTFHDNN